jgi:hypothetical protein
MEERCPCGHPLHYTRPESRAFVENLIAELGPDMLITTPEGSWLVPRHYVALHGVAGKDLSALGFPKIVPHG